MSSRVSSVEIDGLVILKMLKHSRESTSSVNTVSAATGVLLGLDVDNVLEVTHSFPRFRSQQQQGDISSADPEEDERLQIELMKRLRDVNMDANVVGWYSCSNAGSHFLANVETQFQYEREFGHRAVFVLLDTLRASQGNLSVKALRLSAAFYDLFRETKHFTADMLKQHKIKADDIFEEMTVRIRNSLLADALLAEMEDSALSSHSSLSSASSFAPSFSLSASSASAPSSSFTSELDRLEMSSSSALEEHMSLLDRSVTDLISEQNRLYNYQRKLVQQNLAQQKLRDLRSAGADVRSEDVDAASQLAKEPNRLDSLLTLSSIKSRCNQINVMAGESMEKLALAMSVQPAASSKIDA